MGNKVTVREARPQDDERIGDLLVEAFVAAYARKMPEVIVSDERKKSLRDVAGKRRQATILVAELEGKVVGTVFLIKPGAPDSEAWLADAADLRQLATDVTLHGRGLAGALLDRIEQIAREDWKMKYVCLHVRRGAEGLARLYRKRGYVRDSAGDLELPDIFLEAYRLNLV